MTIFANGQSLETQAFIVTDASGLYQAPAKTGSDVTMPHRHGALRATRKVYEPGTTVLKITVAGCQHDGTIPGGSSELREMQARLDELARLFEGVVTLQNSRPDGTTRQVVGEVDGGMSFTRIGAGTAATVSIALVVTDAFWQDTTAVSQTVSLASGATATLTGFAAATAPMSQLTLTFGPGANPTLQQPATGAFIAYDGIIGAGQQLTINTDTLELGYGSGSVWNPDETKVRFGGSRSFELRPETGGPTIRLVHTAGGSMSLTVAGRRAYLTA